MNFTKDDGGRLAAGYRGDARDCVVRAIAIANESPYQEIYDKINMIAATGRVGSRRGNSDARTGVYKEAYRPWLENLGWKWHATMKIGSGCKVHLKADELPKGRLIVRVSKHLTAVVDGIIHDTHDPSRDGTRCVYGYFAKD
jgi:hypothetical protein